MARLIESQSQRLLVRSLGVGHLASVFGLVVLLRASDLQDILGALLVLIVGLHNGLDTVGVLDGLSVLGNANRILNELITLNHSAFISRWDLARTLMAITLPLSRCTIFGFS